LCEEIQRHNLPVQFTTDIILFVQTEGLKIPVASAVSLTI